MSATMLQPGTGTGIGAASSHEPSRRQKRHLLPKFVH
jgi:hypothetical protein